MTTRLETLERLPALVPPVVVKAMATRGPRIKKNPDGKMCHARTAGVQSNKLWLIIITHENKPALRYRCRVYLRREDDSLIEIEDRDGFYTESGAEWGAYSALLDVIHDLKRGRTLGLEKDKDQ